MVIILVAGLIVIVMEGNHFEKPVLYQRLEQYFSPALNWEECELPLSSADFYSKVREVLPQYFPDWASLEEVLIDLNYKQMYNEHNQKWYWLVNPS